MIELLVVILIALSPLLWLWAVYNGLVRIRNAVAESWSQIDVELTRRHDLIPNLCAVVAGYAAHEREVLEAVARSRAQALQARGSAGRASRDEQALSGQLGRLLAVSEAMPELRADRHYRELMAQLVDTEDRIQRARRFFNGNVRELNDRVQTIPSSLVAGMFGFTTGEYFTCEPAARLAPRVS